METTMEMYGGKVYGVEVSHYGREHGYLDYYTLSKILGDVILNNNLMTFDGLEWELVSGEDVYGCDVDGEPCDIESDECYNIYPINVYQTYIISESGYQFLNRYTDEIVYYNEELDLYLWGITHFGTSWDYVLTDIKVKERDEACL